MRSNAKRIAALTLAVLMSLTALPSLAGEYSSGTLNVKDRVKQPTQVPVEETETPAPEIEQEEPAVQPTAEPTVEPTEEPYVFAPWSGWIDASEASNYVATVCDSPNGSLVGQIRRGEHVNVVEENGSWLRIEGAVSGWVMSRYLSDTEPAPIEKPKATEAPVVEETEAPVVEETEAPVVEETEAPVFEETEAPVVEETEVPVVEETEAPVIEETEAPVVEETEAPVVEETETPVIEETEAPVIEETEAPVVEETEAPVVEETETPVVEETEAPVVEETEAPVIEETEAPVIEETETLEATDGLEVTDEPEATVEPTVTPEPTAEPTPTPVPMVAVKPEADILFERDAEGNLVLDENGDPIAYVRGDLGAPLNFERDAEGNLVLDENGDPAVYIMVEAQPGVEATEEPTVEESVEPEASVEPESTVEPEATVEPEVIVYVYDYERNEDGSLKLDENGMPIAIIPEGETEKPVSYKVDENGNLVLDENGMPIVLATVPVNADKITSIVDELDPSRYIDLYASWGDQELGFGTNATLIAVLYGYDNAVYTLQWQTSSDNANWEDVAGANSERLAVTVTEDNYLDYWRVVVTITDVTAAQ